MAWIRLDCSTITDEWADSLQPAERLAWIYFLLHVKANGARGTVPTTSPAILSRQWRIPEGAIRNMLHLATERIAEENGRWIVRNWSKYQEDHKHGNPKTAKGDFPEDALDRTTPPHPTVHNKEQGAKKPRAGGKDVDKYEVPEKLREKWGEWLQFRRELRKPVTPSTARRQLAFLAAQPDPGACIDRSIQQGWQGLFTVDAKAGPPDPIRRLKRCRECGHEWNPQERGSLCPVCYRDKAGPLPDIVVRVASAMGP